MKPVTALAAVVALLSASMEARAQAPGYYITAAGGGSDLAGCSYSAPCVSMARAQALMRAGGLKTTYLFGGTWHPSTTLTLTKADAGERWFNVPGQSPVLDSRGTRLANLISVSGSNIVVSGIKLVNAAAEKSSGQGRDCMVVDGGVDVTLHAMQIGPCGGHGVHVSGGTRINVFDSYIHTEHHPSAKTCCDLNEGVAVDSAASYVAIQGNVIAFNESNVEVHSSDHVSVTGNFLLNPLGPFPRGQNFQSDTGTNISVVGNRTLSSKDPSYPYPDNQEDSINFYYTPNPLAQGNYVQGGSSASGCAIIADDHTSGAVFTGNIVYDSGACGIGISTGQNQTVTANRVLNLDPVKGGGNTAFYVANYAESYACKGIALSGNVGSSLASSCNPATQSCSYNSLYVDDACTGVTDTTDTFDYDTQPVGGGAAYRMLASTVPLAAPLVPPAPQSCTVVSPYTTQISVPRCK